MENQVVNTLKSGAVHITSQVIESIVEMELEKTEDVKLINQNMMDLFSGKGITNNIEIKIEEDTVYIEVRVIMPYDSDILAISKTIQETVSENVYNMTGLVVGQVDITVVDVYKSDGKEVANG